MGVCYLQHRAATGIHNQRAKRVSLSKTFPSMLSLLFGGWFQFLRPCLSAVILIIYSYIIVMTLAVTVDLPYLIKLVNHQRFSMAKEMAIYGLPIRNELNLYFLLILRFLFKNRSFIARRLRKLAKSKINYVGSIISFFFSFWLMSLNLLLIIICYPGILNPGPVISGLYQNVRGFVPFRGLNESVLPLSATKLQDFQSYVFNKDPGFVVLNETWLSSDHFSGTRLIHLWTSTFLL